VTAILAIMLAAVFCVIVGYATVEYIHNGREVARDIVTTGFGAVVGAFTGVISMYITNRINQGGS